MQTNSEDLSLFALVIESGESMQKQWLPCSKCLAAVQAQSPRGLPGQEMRSTHSTRTTSVSRRITEQQPRWCFETLMKIRDRQIRESLSLSPWLNACPTRGPPTYSLKIHQTGTPSRAALRRPKSPCRRLDCLVILLHRRPPAQCRGSKSRCRRCRRCRCLACPLA